MNGGVCFLPSMMPGLGIIQLLCESSSHLSLTACPARPVGSGLLSGASRKGRGPPCRCLLSDKLVSRGFSVPGSSVRGTGVPGALLTRLNQGHGCQDGGDFPPGNGSFYQPE